MLVRSPRTPVIELNIDVVFWGVEFIGIPTVLVGIEIDTAAPDQAKATGTQLRKSVEAGHVYSLATADERYVVIARGFKVFQNALDIFDSTLVDFTIDRPLEEYGIVLAHS
jgi:hypothetical protein